MKETKRAIVMSLLFGFGQFIAMDQSGQQGEAKEKKTIKHDQWREVMTSYLSQPVHTVLFYGTMMYCTDGRRGDKYRRGIFLTVFGLEPDSVGEVCSADDCSRVYKTNIPWSSAYESRKGKPIEMRHIEIGEKVCSLKIEILDKELGIIQVIKEFSVPRKNDKK